MHKVLEGPNAPQTTTDPDELEAAGVKVLDRPVFHHLWPCGPHDLTETCEEWRFRQAHKLPKKNAPILEEDVD